MRRAAELYHQHKADCVVIGTNHGGDYLPALLMEVDTTVNRPIVHATRGTRARVHHVGPARLYAELEEQPWRCSASSREGS